MMFNAPLRAKQAAQNSKNPGRAVFAAGPKTQKHQNSKKNRRARGKFFGKIILKIWGLCLPLFDRGCFVFFF